MDAIDVLGGTKEVGKLFSPPLSYRVIINWISRGFPPDAYAVLAPVLLDAGHEFSPLLFGQKVPALGTSYFQPPPALQPVRVRKTTPKRKRRKTPVLEDARNG